MKRALRNWQIDAQECEIFGGADSVAAPEELNAALASLPKILARLRENPESGAATVGTSALSISSHPFDHVIGDRVVPALVLVYDVIREESRIVIRKIQLLPGLNETVNEYVGVVDVTDDAYEESVTGAAGMVDKKVFGEKVTVDVEDYDTRVDDFPVTLLNRPLFLEVFLGRDDDE